MADRPQVTKTTHILPFERLSPLDFERLCFWLVDSEGYEGAEHFGAKGNDQGRDVVAWRGGRRVAFQCKRVSHFGPTDAENEIAKLAGLPSETQPHDVVFVVTATVTAETRDRALVAWGDRGSCKFWADSELDVRVKRHRKIMQEFFNLGEQEPLTPERWRRKTEAIIERLIHHVNSALTECNSARIDTSTFDALHEQAKRCYDELESFRDWYAQTSHNWPADQLRSLTQKIDHIARLEHELWSGLKNFFIKIQEDDYVDPKFELVKAYCAGRHAREDFGILQIKFSLPLTSMPLTDTPITESFGKFTNSDELDKVEAFVTLVGHGIDPIVNFLASFEEQGDAHETHLRKFWSVADLVLIEDQIAPASAETRTLRLFTTLSSKESDEFNHFTALNEMLQSTSPPIETYYVNKFRQLGIEPRQEDIEIVWRVMAIGHENINARYQAISAAPLQALWQTIAYHNAPLETLFATTHAVAHRGSDDICKIFFDCIRPRLTKAIATEINTNRLEAISESVEIFLKFDFFMEKVYYAEMELMFGRLKERCQALGVGLEPCQAHFDNLKERVGSWGTTVTSIPKGVDRLPLAVQSHLAAHGAYIEKFACHEDDRIAMKVERYIDSSMIKQMANYCVRNGVTLNRRISTSLSKKHVELFRVELSRFTARGRGVASLRSLADKLSKEELENLGRVRR